jgi:cysteine desulfurase
MNLPSRLTKAVVLKGWTWVLMRDMPNTKPIYLDYAATTPVDPRVVQKMVPYLVENFGNPASAATAYGWAAEEAVEIAREQVAALIGADPREIVWTSGATESNNLAIKGAALFYQAKGKHLITLEDRAQGGARHLRELEREGFEVTYLDVSPTACSTWPLLEAALRPDTILVSVMHVNNEIGVIQDIAAIGAAVPQPGVLSTWTRPRPPARWPST